METQHPSLEQSPLEGKVAIITGAGRGIGRAIALAYGEAGASVCCTARTQDEIDQVAHAINSARTGEQSTDKHSAIAIAADVTQTTEIEKVVAETMSAFGRIDILVLNAGTQLDRNRIDESDSEDWWKTIEVNLYGPYCCAKAVIPHLKANGGGKIITLGSGMGHRASAGSSAYSISKAGLWMFTRILAQEVAEFNISVNELIPGPVNTSMTTNSSAQGSVAFTTGSEWIKQPEDVVPLALWLATQPDIGPTAQSFSLMRRDK